MSAISRMQNNFVKKCLAVASVETVDRSVDWMVCHNLLKGKFHFHSSIGALVVYTILFSRCNEGISKEKDYYREA